jgi:hypothetical protein
MVNREHIMCVETSDAWSEWRDNLAKEMFDQWKATRRGSLDQVYLVSFHSTMY